MLKESIEATTALIELERGTPKSFNTRQYKMFLHTTGDGSNKVFSGVSNEGCYIRI